MEEKRELVFVPAPALGHMASTIELANRLLTIDHHHHQRISITILIVRFPYPDPKINAYFESLPSIFPNIRFIILPHVDPPPVPEHVAIETLVSLYVEKWKPHVKNAITQLTESTPSRLAGLVMDIFFTALMDVAKELRVPAYLNFTTNAAMLGLMLHLPSLDAQFSSTTTEFTDSEAELAIPSYANSVPPNVLPSALLNKTDDAYKWYVYHSCRFKQMNGMLVNTFPELERYALDSFSGTPKVYAVGPIIDLEGKGQLRPPVEGGERERIMKWLDRQPTGSVVLICFGSGGGLSAVEVREIAVGLEASGYRFLWALREPWRLSRGQKAVEEDPRDGLPEGFERRVEGRGMVCGWVGQVEVLGHGALGGFVSHCGWNSILESLWFGVPIATWPMYAEQQLNAFYTVREKGMAVEIRLDYRLGGGGVVTAEEVERGIRRVMEKESEVRRRVEEMSKRSREAARDGGSSFASMERFIEDLVNDNKVTSM